MENEFGGKNMKEWIKSKNLQLLNDDFSEDKKANGTNKSVIKNLKFE